MNYLKAYTDTIRERGNEGLAKTIEKTAAEVGQKYLADFDYVSHKIGLLFGNVQSGKTAQMFGIICEAADQGFAAFLLLTTDNVALQQQTLQRVENDLGHFCICGENDAMKFTENALVKPVIIVLKKNYRVLRQWANIMRSTSFMIGNPLFILDDEADAASLNTLVNSSRQSSINRYLDYIKSEASSSIYLQVTGTPQAIFLQTIMSGFRPYFTYYFKPGKGYLGGDFFFSESGRSCIRLIDDMDEPLRQAVFHHLAVSIQLLKSGVPAANFMIHPSVRMNIHNKYKKEIENILHEIHTDFESESIQNLLRETYNRLHPQKHMLLPFGQIKQGVWELLENKEIKILIMNGKHEVRAEEYASGSNILIGGNTLGRGVTFSGLHTIFYTRTAKKPQADTMWQHSRMFGYDRDPGLIELYLDNRLYKLFCDINATNNAIIAQIERGIENVKMYYPEELSPTRKEVLDKRYVFAVSGGTNYFPFDPVNDSIEELDTLLQPFDDHVEKYQVSMQIIKRVLEHIQTEPEFPLKAFMSIINMYIAKNPGVQANLIVRRNRDIKKGSGALLSPNDWNIGKNITDKVVLTVYKMTGSKGWDGQKIWVPNIKFPDDAIYYDVADADE